MWTFTRQSFVLARVHVLFPRLVSLSWGNTRKLFVHRLDLCENERERASSCNGYCERSGKMLFYGNCKARKERLTKRSLMNVAEELFSELCWLCKETQFQMLSFQKVLLSISFNVFLLGPYHAIWTWTKVVAPISPFGADENFFRCFFLSASLERYIRWYTRTGA